MSAVAQTTESTTRPDLRTRVTDSLDRLRTYIESQNFRGYDPYDALNSPLLRLLTLGRKYPRIAAIMLLSHVHSTDPKPSTSYTRYAHPITSLVVFSSSIDFSPFPRYVDAQRIVLDRNDGRSSKQSSQSWLALACPT